MAFHYSFDGKKVMHLTRRRLVIYLNGLGEIERSNKEFQAALRGLKLESPIQKNTFKKSVRDDLARIAKEKYDQLKERNDS